MAERGAGAAAANAAQYAAAAQAYSDAAHGAAAGITDLRGQVDALTAAMAAAVSALGSIKGGGGGRGPGGGGSGGGETPAQKAAKADARAAEYVYRLKRRYLQGVDRDEAKAAAQQAARTKAAQAQVERTARQQQAAKLSQYRAEQRAKERAEDKAGASEVGQPGVNKDLRYALKQAGVSKAAMRAPVTAAAFEAGKLALGLKGMAALDVAGMRATMMLRQLFRGVDPSPVIRGVNLLISTALSPAGATGKALEGIFNRTFNSLFRSVEKLAPIAAAAFQGFVIGGLLAENAFAHARLALFPITDALEEFLGPLDTMSMAVTAGEVAFGALGIAAVASGASAALAWAPFIGAIGGVVAAIDQGIKLYKEWDDLKKAQAGEAQVRVFGAGSDEGNRFYGTKAASMDAGAGVHSKEFLDKQAAQGKGAAEQYKSGKITGEEYAAGLAAGLDSGGGAVDAAAGRLGLRPDAKVRSVTETHSPSRVAARTGAEFPAGYAQGIDEGAPGVQRAADRMAPNAPTGSRSSALGGSMQVTVIHQWPAGMKRDADVEGNAEAGTMRALRSIALQLAIPVRT